MINNTKFIHKMETKNEGNGYILVPYVPFTIGTIYNGKFSVSNELRKYLEWRCVRNWHKKYHKYINTWIENILPYQCDYFVEEMCHLIEQGIYKISLS